MADHHAPDDAWPIAELPGGGARLFLIRLEMLAPDRSLRETSAAGRRPPWPRRSTKFAGLVLNP